MFPTPEELYGPYPLIPRDEWKRKIEAMERNPMELLKQRGIVPIDQYNPPTTFKEWTMLINQQEPQGRDWDVTGKLKVFDVWRTIQGEGPFVGDRAVFVRLAGCNLQCNLCDTDYTSKVREFTKFELMYHIQELAPDWKFVVITGGEPLRQNIRPFCELLAESDFIVQIETNGTFHFPDLDNVFVVCSPKTPSINKDLDVWAYKYVLDADHVDPKDGLPTSVLGMPLHPARPRSNAHTDYMLEPVYVQPLDECDPVKNARHMKAAAESCRKYGYKLCLQIHKIAGLE